MRLKSNPLTPEREAIFWSYVDVEPGQCWLWTRSTIQGYGQFKVDSMSRASPARTHTLAWRILIGTPPPGTTPHHNCHTPACCNPDHIEWLTAKEHRERHRPNKARCKNNHPITADTYDFKHHRCRICMADRTKRARRDGRPYANRNGQWYKKRREAA